MPKVRFATIGSSGICERFLEALAEVEGAAYVAAYSRSVERAREFGGAHGATLFFDSLDDLAACDEVDAVYIATPNFLHASGALPMLRAGKHVLLEKPIASNASEAEELFAVAQQQGVVLMEAIRPLHRPDFHALEDLVAQLGEVRLASFRFSKVTSRIERLRAGERVPIFDPTHSAGALMDMGVYAVAPAVALFGEPEGIQASAILAQVPGTEPGDAHSVIDLGGEAILSYGDHLATVSWGKLTDDVLSSQVQCDDGTAIWDGPGGAKGLWVHRHAEKGMIYTSASHDLQEVPFEVVENDMRCEIEDFCSAVRGEDAGVAIASRCADVTRASMRVLDQIRRQIGVTFPADDEA